MQRLRVFLISVLALIATGPALAQAFDTKATAAWVFDMTTGTVLLNKNADLPLPPASMSKLMTVNMAFEALKDGRLSLDTQLGVSTRAKNMGGSTMFLNENDRPTVEDLIRGIVVQSGNDACVVMAEGLAGTEEAFARSMTERARALGMMNSTFANASGWPDPNQRMSMHDLGLLAVRLITEFPEYYGYFSLTEFAYDGRSPDNHSNRNPLLKLGIGADGLKTGHTSEAGYGLVGSAVQGGRRIVFVITGLNSETERAQESERIANWAFRQFAMKTLGKSGTEIARAEVYLGAARDVSLVLGEDLTLLLPALAQESVASEVVYTGPLEAPIAKGQPVAELIISALDMADRRVVLHAGEDIAKGGYFTRIWTAAQILTTRLNAALGS